MEDTNALYDKYFGAGGSSKDSSPSTSQAQKDLSSSSPELDAEYAKYFGSEKKASPAAALPPIQMTKPLAPGPRAIPPPTLPQSTISAPEDQHQFTVNADMANNPLRDAVVGTLASMQTAKGDPFGSLKTIGTMGRNFISSVEGVAYDTTKAIESFLDHKSTVTKAAAVLQAGVSIFNATPEMQGISALTETAQNKGLNVGGKVPILSTAANVVNDTIGGVQRLIGGATGAALDATPDSVVSPEAKAILKGPLENAVGLVGVIAGFHAVHGALGEASSAISNKLSSKKASVSAEPFLSALGLETGPKGTLPDKATVDAAYKQQMETMPEGTPNQIAVKQNMLTTAYRAISDYHEQGPTAFVQSWGDAGKFISDNMENIQKNAQDGIDQTRHTSDVAAAMELRRTPIDTTDTGAPKWSQLHESGKLAYEIESADNFNQTVKKAQETTPNIRVTDVPFDKNPGTFDPQTGEITLNQHAIMDLVDRAESGESMIVGEGAQQYILEAKPGETRQELEARITNDIIEHEKAHLATVSPEDAAILKVAKETGDQATYSKKVKELEEKANAVRQKPSSMESGVYEAAHRETQRVTHLLNTQDALKNLVFHGDTELEAGYRKWKESVKRSPDLKNLDYQGLSNRLGKQSGYEGTGAVEKRFGLSTSRELTHDAALDKFRERLAAETSIKEKSARTLQGDLFKPRGEDQAKMQKVVREEVRKAVDEKQAEFRAETKRRLANLDEVSRAREERRLNAQKGEFTHKLLDQKINLETKAYLDRVILRIQKDNIIMRLKDEKVTTKAVQGDIMRYFRENIPPEMRRDVAQSVLWEIRQASSKTDLQEVFQRIEQDYNRVERKNLIEKTKKELADTKLKYENGVAKSKFGTAQRALDAIREGSKMPRRDAFAERLNNIRNAKRDPVTGELDPKTVLRNQILETFGIKEQSNSQLKNTLQLIQDLKERGKTEVQTRQEARQLKTDRNVIMAKRVLTGGKELPTEVRGVGETGPGVLQAIRDKGLSALRSLKYARAPLEFIMDSLSMNDKGSKYMDSPFNAMAHRAVRAIGETLKMNTADETLRNAAFEDAYGVTGVAGLEKVNEMMTKREVVGTFKDADGKDVTLKMTPMERINLFKDTRNERSMKQVTERNRWTPEMIEAATKGLSEQDKAFAQANLDYYKAKLPAFREAYLRDNGTELGEILNYVPTRSLGEGPLVNDPETSLASKLAEDAMYQTPGYKPGTSKLRSNVSVMDFNYNPMEQMRSYSSRVNHYINNIDVIHELDGTFKNKGVRELITKQFGKEALSYLDHQLDMIRRGGRDMAGTNRFAEKLMNNVSAAMINNFHTAAKQIPSGVLQMYAEARSTPAFAKGIADFITDPKGKTELLKQYAPEFEAHTKSSGQVDYSRASSSQILRQKLGINKLSDILKTPLKAASALGTTPGAWSLFKDTADRMIEQGHTQEEAYQIAGRELEATLVRIRPTFNYTGKTYLETSSTFNKALSMIQNHPQKMFLVPAHAIEAAMKGRLEWSKAMKVVAIYNLMLPAASAAAVYASKQAGNAASDMLFPTTELEKQQRDKKEGSIFRAMALEVISSPFTMQELTGQFYRGFIQIATGAQPGFNPSPILSTGQDLFSGFQQVMQGHVDEALDYGLRVGGAGAGVPLSQEMSQYLINQAKAARKAQGKTPEGRAAASKVRSDKARAKLK